MLRKEIQDRMKGKIDGAQKKDEHGFSTNRSHLENIELSNETNQFFKEAEKKWMPLSFYCYLNYLKK